MTGITKLSAIFLATICAVAIQATSASAFVLAGDYTGDLEFKFSDFSEGNLYQSSSNGYGQSDGVEDAWGIFKISTIKTPAAQTLWSDGQDGEELTGIFYNLDDDYYEVTPAGGLNIQSVGGIIDVYLGSSTVDSFDPTGGPGARGLGATYPTVTDGELFLRLVMVPGIKFGNGTTVDDHIAYDNNLDGTTSPFTGDGAFYANVAGGSFANIFNTGTQCVTDDSNVEHCNDFFGIFDTQAGPNVQTFGFLVKSEDPISGASQSAPVPEPATMTLLGAGLVGMVMRKKKNS